MSEMTVSQHNEQLILEKAQLQAFYQQQLGATARVITVLMGRNKTKTVTAQQLAEAQDAVIQFVPDADGGLVVSQESKPPDVA